MKIKRTLAAVALVVSLAGCTVLQGGKGKTERGYNKLPYKEWKFLFIYPKALPAVATLALMEDGAGYVTNYQYIDTTESSDVSVGRWNDRLGATQAHYNKGKAVPLMLRFCWDSIIDKKSYETLVTFGDSTREQMVTLYSDSYRPGQTYYRNVMIIGLAPGGKVRIWLGDRGDPVVEQKDAKITTWSGDKMDMCVGVTKSDFSYGYDQDIKDLIKGKTWPYGSW